MARDGGWTKLRISDVCALPLLVDIDTGFGNAVNTYRTVRLVERAGASAVQIEDQIFPKKCGHFAGKGVVPLPEMLGKLKAALDAPGTPTSRSPPAPTPFPSRASTPRRSAPTSRSDIERIAALPVPQVMNVVIGGKTPMLPLEELRELGFGMVLYANAALQATTLAVQDVLQHLRDRAIRLDDVRRLLPQSTLSLGEAVAATGFGGAAHCA